MNDSDSTYINVYALILWTLAVAFYSHEYFEMYGKKEMERKVMAVHQEKLMNCHRIIAGKMYE